MIGILKLLSRSYRNRQHRELENRFRSLAEIGEGFAVDPRAAILNESGDPKRIRIGSHVNVVGELICKASGNLSIGDYSVVRGTLQCLTELTVGSYTGIAPGSMITDNNTHALGVENWVRHRIRTAPEGPGYPGLGNGWELADSAPVRIGDGVWIGENTTILKGVTIGDGAIVARNAVVTKDVPAFAVIAGNPGRIVRQMEPPAESVLEIARRIHAESIGGP